MLLDAPPLPGDQVGTYTLREVLGVGGMATVYKATDRRGRMIAVKILHPGKAETDDGRRFQREFLTLRELRDENIVQVFEAGVQGDYPWIAMELVDGTDLGTLVEQWEAEGRRDMAQRANAQWKRMLAEYQAPPIDPAIDEALRDFISRRKASMPDATH